MVISVLIQSVARIYSSNIPYYTLLYILLQRSSLFVSFHPSNALTTSFGFMHPEIVFRISSLRRSSNICLCRKDFTANNFYVRRYLKANLTRSQEINLQFKNCRVQRFRLYLLQTTFFLLTFPFSAFVTFHNIILVNPLILLIGNHY